MQFKGEQGIERTAAPAGGMATTLPSSKQAAEATVGTARARAEALILVEGQLKNQKLLPWFEHEFCTRLPA